MTAAASIASAPPRLVVHIGPMKTGSTSLQRTLALHADALAAAGVSYPLHEDSVTWHPHNQQRAVYGMFGSVVPWVTPQRQHHYRAAGAHLAQTLEQWPGDVLLSAEAFSAMTAADLADSLRTLAAPAQRGITVIAVLRDLARALPSQWQQDLRSGRGRDLAEFLDRFRTGSDRGSGNARTMFDYAHQVERLIAAVGVESVVVVTVPPPGNPPDLLWRRFAEATGLPAVRAIDPARGDQAANRSLSAAECETLRRLNLALHDAGADPQRTATLRYRIVREAWWPRDRRDAPVALPAAALDWLEPICQHARDTIRATGVPLIGEWDDLLPHPAHSPAGSGGLDGAVDPSALLAAHEAALAWLAGVWAEPVEPPAMPAAAKPGLLSRVRGRSGAAPAR